MAHGISPVLLFRGDVTLHGGACRQCTFSAMRRTSHGASQHYCLPCQGCTHSSGFDLVRKMLRKEYLRLSIPAHAGTP